MSHPQCGARERLSGNPKGVGKFASDAFFYYIFSSLLVGSPTLYILRLGVEWFQTKMDRDPGEMVLLRHHSQNIICICHYPGWEGLGSREKNGPNYNT